MVVKNEPKCSCFKRQSVELRQTNARVWNNGSHSLRSNSASHGANHPQQMFRNVQSDLWRSSEEQPSQPLVLFFSSVLQGQAIALREHVSTTILFTAAKIFPGPRRFTIREGRTSIDHRTLGPRGGVCLYTSGLHGPPQNDQFSFCFIFIYKRWT